MWLRNGLVAAGGFGIAFVLLAGGIPAASQQAGVRLAVIDNDRILQESNPGRATTERIQQSFNQWQARISSVDQQLTALLQRRSEQSVTLTAAALQSLDDEIEQNRIDLERTRDDAQREFGRLRDTALNEMEQTLVPIIQQLAEQNGYRVIFNTQTPGLLYSSDAIDVTDDYIALVNAQVPAAEPGRSP